MNHNSEDEQALRRIQHDWADARLKRDSSFPRQIEADDFTVVWFDGRIVNKEEDVRSYESDDVTFTEFNIGDLQVRFYGDTAIVVAQGSLKAHAKNQDLQRKIRVDGYVCETGRRMEGRRIAGNSRL